ADRNRSHWSTSKTPSYTKSVSWHHHQLREEEWSEFFFWLLNSLECLDYVIINLTPESKKKLMSEHRNNIQVAIDALYSQRRRKSPGDESETLTRRNDAIFGNHVWQTFAQYFPPGLEKPSV
ncbi:hypothetical protein, partial [Escherichia coli]|uniref:hypothetical protein n=1 Tax=Escherichia coli TaxID=562 RepID=UPI001F4EAEA9